MGVCLLCLPFKTCASSPPAVGTSFFSLMTQLLNPGTHFTSPFPCPHRQALPQDQKHPKSPMFSPSEFQDLQFLHYKGERIYAFSFSLSCGDEQAERLSPHSTLSKPLPSRGPPQLSKPDRAHGPREPHKGPPGVMEESAKFF